MGFEIQKACLIPVTTGPGWKGDSPITTEVWQTVANCGDQFEAAKKMRDYLRYNKGRGFFYRMIEVLSMEKS